MWGKRKLYCDTFAYDGGILWIFLSLQGEYGAGSLAGKVWVHHCDSVPRIRICIQFRYTILQRLCPHFFKHKPVSLWVLVAVPSRFVNKVLGAANPDGKPSREWGKADSRKQSESINI